MRVPVDRASWYWGTYPQARTLQNRLQNADLASKILQQNQALARRRGESIDPTKPNFRSPSGRKHERQLLGDTRH